MSQQRERYGVSVTIQKTQNGKTFDNRKCQTNCVMCMIPNPRREKQQKDNRIIDLRRNCDTQLTESKLNKSNNLY